MHLSPPRRLLQLLNLSLLGNPLDPTDYQMHITNDSALLSAPPSLQCLQLQCPLPLFPSEMLQAYIVALPKPGKEPTSPANFRSILLLNTDAKLHAKILAHRLMPIFPILIKPDQSSFISGCQASDATRRVIDII